MKRAARVGDLRDSGVATVTGIVLLFAFTSGAVIWLARDVDRTVANRSAAQSIAFQAARAGAQQVDVSAVREGSPPRIEIESATSTSRTVVSALLDGYGLDGELVRVTVIDDLVEVEVRVLDPAGDVTGIAAARAEVAP
jgi:hypothetical protein